MLHHKDRLLKPYYVYLLIDPRDNKIFYVGKGTEDRVSQHEKEVNREIVITKKQKILNDIYKSGMKEKRLVVGRFDTEQESFAVEAVLIHWVYGKDNLTNDQSGHMVNYIRPKNNFDYLPGIDEPDFDYSEREREKRGRYDVIPYLEEIRDIIEKKFDVKFDGIDKTDAKHTYLYKKICGVKLAVVTHHNPKQSATVTIQSISTTEKDRNSVKKICQTTRLEFKRNGQYARIKPGMVNSIDLILEQFEETYNEILKYKKSTTM